ncbi:hypothetical protein [Candidatus Pyrohabitans sp.]
MRKLLFLLLIVLPSYVFAEPTLVVDLQEEGKAEITYEIKDVEDIENLTRILQNPMLQAIVGERMASLFCWAIEDFLIVPQKDRVTILVDCGEFAKKQGETRETEARNLTNIKPITITVNLPAESKLIAAEPEPSEVREGSLVWRNVTFLPKVIYKEEGFSLRYAAAVAIAGIGVLLILMKRWK